MLAGHVLTAWRIPEPVPQVVAWHHQPGRAYSVGGPVGMMVALLRLADAIDCQLRLDPSLDDAFIEQLAHGGEADYLGFTASDLRAIRPVMLEARTEVLSIFS